MNMCIGAQLAQKVQSRQQCLILGMVPALILKEALKHELKDEKDKNPYSFKSEFYGKNRNQSSKAESQPKQ